VLVVEFLKHYSTTPSGNQVTGLVIHAVPELVIAEIGAGST
jgi:hypothetical protein